jgi:hypothetical protein
MQGKMKSHPALLVISEVLAAAKIQRRDKWRQIVAQFQDKKREGDFLAFEVEVWKLHIFPKQNLPAGSDGQITRRMEVGEA